MIDAKELLDDALFTESVGLVKSEVTIDEHGRAQKTETETPIVASFQPVTNQDLNLMPEGTRISNTAIVYTVANINLGDIIRNNGDWEVIQIMEDIGHKKAMVVRNG